MPSVPSFPRARQEAERPTAGREYESFESVEPFTAVLPAGTAFTEIAPFSGTTDSVLVHATAAGIEVRVRRRGEAPGRAFTLPANDVVELRTGAESLEARDSGGVGGQTVIVLGRFASRTIERRVSRRGPLASDMRPRDQAAPELIEPR